MSKRLYYDDPYVAIFDAKVTEHVRVGDKLAIALNKTYFYPTSGGQPADHGTINDIPVLDVSIRESDGVILHLLADEIWVDQVHCKIDWPRRFDHMQQHTGQHILSAAFNKVAKAETVGFHLGSQSCTIDLATHSLTAEQAEQAETLSNEVIFANRLVRSTVLTPEQVALLPLRKPPQVEGPIRIVEVEKFDLCACGGTHVNHAGEIGAIKITKIENRGKGTRVEFLCGRRALADYRFKNKLMNQLAAQFTTSHDQVAPSVARLMQEIKNLRNEMRKAHANLLEYEARDFFHTAEEHNGIRIVSAIFPERDRREINWIAKWLSERPSVVVLFGLAGEKSHILFSRSEDVDRDMVMLLKTALRVLGSTSGGGRADMAQGGGPAADEKRVGQAIDRAKRLLLAQK